MRLCMNCLMAHIDASTGIHTVRRLDFSDGFHWCKNCVEGVWCEPALYFVITLEYVEAKKSF